MQRIVTTILLCLFLGCAGSGGGPPVKDAGYWDGEVRVDGALRAMLHEGQTGTKVTLDAVLPNPDLYAVGALADLAGEVTILGGTAYLSYAEGGDDVRTETTTEGRAGATLLVAAEVPAWHVVTTEDRIPFEGLDDAIGKLAASEGMSLDARFPFLLEGNFEDLQWHVIDGTQLAAGGASHHDHLAAGAKSRLDRTSATLVGFYSRNDQGVFTHMGSRTHLHCVLDGPLASGHVDHVVIPAGTTVKFPGTGRERPKKATRRIGSDGR